MRAADLRAIPPSGRSVGCEILDARRHTSVSGKEPLCVARLPDPGRAEPPVRGDTLLSLVNLRGSGRGLWRASWGLCNIPSFMPHGTVLS